MATPTLDRIKESFTRELESLGVVSMDTWRHNALKAAVDKLVDQVSEAVSPSESASESEPVAADPTKLTESALSPSFPDSTPIPASDSTAISDGSSDPQPTESEQTNG